MSDGSEKDAVPAVTIAQEGDCWLVTGEIDLDSIDEFDAALRRTLYSECGPVLDMSAVDFLDSMGLGILLRLRNEGHAVALRNPSTRVRTVLDSTGTAELFHVE